MPIRKYRELSTAGRHVNQCSHYGEQYGGSSKKLKAELLCVCVCVCTQSLSCIRLFVIPWTVARQAPLSMRFSRQEYWSELPFPSSGEFLNPGIEPTSPVSPTLAGRFFTTEQPGKQNYHTTQQSHSWAYNQRKP